MKIRNDFKFKLERFLSLYKLQDEKNYRILCAIGMTESSLNENLIGSMGEIGLMQIWSQTARLYGFDENRLKNDYLYNIHAGSTIWKDLRSRHDFITSINRYNSSSRSNLENSYYISKVLTHLQVIILHELLS